LGYVIVVLLAAAAGGLVYWASMRFAGGSSEAPGDGSAIGVGGRADEDREIRAPNGGDERGAPPKAPEGTAYIPVVPTRGSWQSRLGGIMGLVIAIVIAAAIVAFALYQGGHIISKLLTDAANSG
jgi:hypothetical protein